MPDPTWHRRGPILVATPAPDVTETPGPIRVHDLIACPTCRARVDECCRTPSGHKTTPHGSRLAPRLCPCGALVSPRRRLCDACRDESLRVAKRDYLRRRRARGQKEAA